MAGRKRIPVKVGDLHDGTDGSKGGKYVRRIFVIQIIDLKLVQMKNDEKVRNKFLRSGDQTTRQIP